MDDMPLERLRNAVRSWQRALKREQETRHELQDAIADALDAGMKPKEFRVEVPLSREQIRRHDIDARARRGLPPRGKSSD